MDTDSWYVFKSDLKERVRMQTDFQSVSILMRYANYFKKI